MALIDKEIIRKEIERHLDSAIEHQNANPDMPKYRWYLYEGAKELCTDLLDYLDDTPSEQPESTIMTNEMLMGEIQPKKKSNALFDKCVENCDPVVMKEVSDNVDKMLGREPEKDVDLEKEIEEYIEGCLGSLEGREIASCARYFYELGKNTK